MSTASDTGNLRGSTEMAGSILIVESEGRGSSALAESLREAGFDVHTTSDPGEAARIGRDRHPDLAIVDEELAVAVAQATELAAAAILLADDPQGDRPGSGTDEFMDVIARPATVDRVLALARLASEVGGLSRRIAGLEKELSGYRSGSAMLGCSPSMRRLSSVLSRAAESDATVLIEGKPGSGKTLAAQIIHASGRRSDRPLIAVPSAAVDDRGMVSLLSEADGATLLLEDVDQLPTQAQGTLVRFLKERTQRGQVSGPDVRLVTTTSARLPEQVARGAFREDLYYRLSLFPIVIPALHERREDVALLAMHFLKQVSEESGTPVRGFTPTAMMLLESHPWPGNAAQLETSIRRAYSLAGGGPIDRMHLLGPATGLEADHDHPLETPRSAVGDDEEPTEADILPMEEEEKRLLTRALRATGGNVRRASRLLGIGRATLYRKIQIYKLKLN